MMENAEKLELNDRLKLIESMMAEGRRKTESWGWSFLLWGVAYYIATAWATLGHSNFAWPVTMVAAGILTSVMAARMSSGHPETTLGRAIGAVWSAMGVSLFVVLICLGAGGRYDAHVFMAIIGAMLATATACFGSETVVSIAFLSATFFCQIVFGIYAMILDARRRQPGAAHA